MAEAKHFPLATAVTATIVIAVAVSLSLPWIGLEVTHEPYGGSAYTWTTKFYMDHYVVDNGASVSYDDEEPIAILMWQETVLMYAWIIAGWLFLLVSLAGLNPMRYIVGWIAAVISIVAAVNFFANSPSALDGYMSVYGDMVWGLSTGWVIILMSCIVQVATMIVLTREVFAKIIGRPRPTERPTTK